MSSRFTHTICVDCWIKKNPDRQPTRVTGFKCETCCYCKSPTLDGIYVRGKPEETPCKGIHPEEASTS